MHNDETNPSEDRPGDVVRLFSTDQPEARRADIEIHSRLLRQYRTLLRQRDRVKTHFAASKKPDATPESTIQRLRKCSSTVRARMAIRAAVFKMRNTERRFPAPIQLLGDELAFLEKKARFTNAQLRKLEKRITDQAPVSQQDARALLTFLATLTVNGRAFSRREFADILLRCANAAAQPANHSAVAPSGQHAT